MALKGSNEVCGGCMGLFGWLVGCVVSIWGFLAVFFIVGGFWGVGGILYRVEGRKWL